MIGVQFLRIKHGMTVRSMKYYPSQCLARGFPVSPIRLKEGYIYRWSLERERDKNEGKYIVWIDKERNIIRMPRWRGHAKRMYKREEEASRALHAFQGHMISHTAEC